MGKIMAMKPAPIGLSVYSRLGHLKRTIEALQRNELARKSELYIFSDAPKSGDEKKVADVREFLKTISGFKSVHIIERRENNRVDNNRRGMKHLLDHYGKMIFLEEDIVTSPLFLTFMNESLEYFRDDSRIFAINGYTPPIQLPTDYGSEMLLLPRFAAWGFGIWKDRYDRIRMNIDSAMYTDLMGNRKLRSEYCAGGDDAITQLWLESRHYIDALDVKIDYTMFVDGRQYVVCPRKSLTHSTGLDGSGEHWTRPTTRHDVDLASDAAYRIAFPEEISPNTEVIENLRRFYSLGIKGKLAKIVMEIGLYPLYLFLRRRNR